MGNEAPFWSKEKLCVDDTPSRPEEMSGHKTSKAMSGRTPICLEEEGGRKASIERRKIARRHPIKREEGRAKNDR